MAVSYIIIGRHIKAARKTCKLTQEDMAEVLKMSVAHYGRLERGERFINLERLSQISIILKVPIERLVEGCVQESEVLHMDNVPEDTFLKTMMQYAQNCSEESLSRMLRVCEVLAAEDLKKHN